MTRDYKKNINRKKQDKPLAHSLLPFITGLSIGLFVAFIVYIREHQPYNLGARAPKLVVYNKNDKPAAGQQEKQVRKNDVPEPKFDFYQILPNMEVNVSEWEAGGSKSNEAITDKSGVYILQVGSFEQYEAADEVKAKLALLGINADIQRVVINGRDVRHRVRVGPYKDPAKLQEARDLLLANKLDFMLLKLKVDDM